MVHRHLSDPVRPRAAFATACLLALILAAPALAANRRISISHYQWSDANIQINLGEHVTWYWIGPDTMHSITGTGADNQPVDSDPGTDTPRHSIGDHFQVSFDQPGTYSFHCKLHPFVRGTVTVSSTPGDPSTEPDPVPRSNVDLKAPYLDGIHLDSDRFGKAGTRLHYGTDERAKLDAEIYRIGKHHRRHFAGWQDWSFGHVGYNHVHFGYPSEHFKPRPGHYKAYLRATDASHNESRAHPVLFSVR
ncbi:MAG: hypothetical protein QOE29_2448 [Gaiellaceae bacterium]|nr:hypothetical protein [Gaiellaceae bacterium]